MIHRALFKAQSRNDPCGALYDSGKINDGFTRNSTPCCYIANREKDDRNVDSDCSTGVKCVIIYNISYVSTTN